MNELFVLTSLDTVRIALSVSSRYWGIQAFGTHSRQFPERRISISQLCDRLEREYPDCKAFGVLFSTREIEAGRNPFAPAFENIELWSRFGHEQQMELLNQSFQSCAIAVPGHVPVDEDYILLTRSPEAEESLQRRDACELKRIIVENFKGFGARKEIELRPITLLFGPNSAGKSTVLHALHYLREILERRNLNADVTAGSGTHVDLGGFRSFVHNHDLNNSVTLGLTIETFSLVDQAMEDSDDLEHISELIGFPGSPPKSFGYGTHATVEIVVSWSSFHRRPFVSCYRVFYLDDLFAQISSDPDGKRVLLDRLDLSHRILHTVRSWADESEQEECDNLFAENDLILALAFDRLRGEFETLKSFTETAATFDPHFLVGQPDALPNLDGQLLFSNSEEERSSLSSERLNERLHEFSQSHSAVREFEKGLDRLIAGPLRLIRKWLVNHRYLGPLRETPPRIYEPPRFSESARWSSGLGAWDELHTSAPGFVEEVSSWLGDPDRLDSGYGLRLKTFREIDAESTLFRILEKGALTDEDADRIAGPLSRLPETVRLEIVRTSQADPESQVLLRPSDVGVGISQVIPVIVSALGQPGRLISIEQPELHLHPRIAARLGDLFLTAISRQVGHHVILETHSEHLILRLLRRIRETTKSTVPPENALFSEDVIIHYISCEHGNSSIRTIELDENGDFIQPWPDDFFELDFYERFSS